MRIHKINYVIKVPFDDNGALLPAEKYKLFEDEGSLGNYLLTDYREYFDEDTLFTITQEEDFTGLIFNLGEDLYYKTDGVFIRFARHKFNFVHLPDNCTGELEAMKGQFSIFCIGFSLPYLKTWCEQFPGLKKFLKRIRSKEPCSLNEVHMATPSEVISLLDRILLFPSLKGQRDVFFNSKIYDILNHCLTASVKGQFPKADSDSFNIELVIKIISEDLRTEWTIDLMADRLGMHQSKLRRMLNKHEATVYRLLTEERLKAGFKLVVDGTLPLSDIARKIGYSSLSNFIRAFKNKFGKTPEKVRAQNISS